MISTSEKLGFNQPVFSDVTAKILDFSATFFKRFRKQQKYLFVASTTTATFEKWVRNPTDSHEFQHHLLVQRPTESSKSSILVTLICFKIFKMLEMINEKINENQKIHVDNNSA